MGLFVQSIVLRMTDERYVVEKVALPELTKEKIDLTVLPGTIAVLGGVKYKGQESPYKLTREIVGSKRASVDVYLFPDKSFDNFTISFFGGQHVVSISSLPSAKAKFSIVGTATVEIADYKELAGYFKRSMTKEDLIEEINKNFRGHLSNEVSVAASRYITPETTEVTLRGALESVSQEVMKSRKTASLLMGMGLILSARGISMHLNALEDADDKFRIINDALTSKAISSLDNDILDREERERAAARQHEIDLIRAQRTEIKDTTETRNINTNTNTQGGGTVNIINSSAPSAAPAAKKAAPEKRFCTECGKEVAREGAKFCPFCGGKL